MSCMFAVAVSLVTNASLWLNSLSLALLIVGLILTLRKRSALKDGTPRGLAAFVCFGPLFFAVPMAVFGMQHFAFRNVVVEAVPAFMPDRMFWVWLVGVALIAAALSLIIGRLAPLAALLLGVMFFVFVLTIYIPGAASSPRDRFAWTFLCRDLALGGAALALAGTLAAETHAAATRWLRLAGRYFFGVPMIFFGIEHFLHPHSAPGVPLELLMPAWMPFQVIWGWLTGVVLLVGGLCILLNKRGALAATILGVSYLILVLLVYTPMELMHPSIEISGELDYLAETLAFSGAALLVAGSLLVPTSRAELRTP